MCGHVRASKMHSIQPQTGSAHPPDEWAGLHVHACLPARPAADDSGRACLLVLLPVTAAQAGCPCAQCRYRLDVHRPADAPAVQQARRALFLVALPAALELTPTVSDVLLVLQALLDAGADLNAHVSGDRWQLQMIADGNRLSC